MKPYYLEVGWSADDFHAARIALKACRDINPDDPVAAAKMIIEVWRVLNEARGPVEREADRRNLHGPNDGSHYWWEMLNLKNRIEAVITKATAKQ
jgi:hypothetical protein